MLSDLVEVCQEIFHCFIRILYSLSSYFRVPSVIAAFFFEL